MSQNKQNPKTKKEDQQHSKNLQKKSFLETMNKWKKELLQSMEQRFREITKLLLSSRAPTQQAQLGFPLTDPYQAQMQRIPMYSEPTQPTPPKEKA